MVCVAWHAHIVSISIILISSFFVSTPGRIEMFHKMDWLPPVAWKNNRVKPRKNHGNLSIATRQVVCLLILQLLSSSYFSVGDVITFVDHDLCLARCCARNCVPYDCSCLET